LQPAEIQGWISVFVRDVAHPACGGRVANKMRVFMFYVYMLFSSSLEKYYVGYTDDVNRRFQQHNAGKGNYTSKGIPWLLIATF
jgi:hypothetical protein